MYKYQLILLGDIQNPIHRDIENRFLQRIDDLGISNEFFNIIKANNFYDEYCNKVPTFVYYIGSIENPKQDTDILKQLVNKCDGICPLYFKEDNFCNEVPKIIHSMNGKYYTPNELDAVVNYALEYFRLLRKTRRVFISYRRKDSTLVAQQLFDKLIKKGFDPFLDSYSIRPADNFQEELYHRITDCDVLIQLYTEGFDESKWCRQEIEEANLKQIGILIVVWPDMKVSKSLHLSLIHQLTNDSFSCKYQINNSRLNDTDADTIVKTVESIRARNLEARQKSICGEFIEEARKKNKKIIREFTYLSEKNKNGECCRLFIPAIGIPQSYDLFESSNFRDRLKNSGLEIYLLYDSFRIRQQWIEHLDWLNKYLDVKTIKKQEFESWLTEH